MYTCYERCVSKAPKSYHLKIIPSVFSTRYPATLRLAHLADSGLDQFSRFILTLNPIHNSIVAHFPISTTVLLGLAR